MKTIITAALFIGAAFPRTAAGYINTLPPFNVKLLRPTILQEGTRGECPGPYCKVGSPVEYSPVGFQENDAIGFAMKHEQVLRMWREMMAEFEKHKHLRNMQVKFSEPIRKELLKALKSGLKGRSFNQKKTGVVIESQFLARKLGGTLKEKLPVQGEELVALMRGLIITLGVVPPPYQPIPETRTPPRFRAESPAHGIRRTGGANSGCVVDERVAPATIDFLRQKATDAAALYCQSVPKPSSDWTIGQTEGCGALDFVETDFECLSKGKQVWSMVKTPMYGGFHYNPVGKGHELPQEIKGFARDDGELFQISYMNPEPFAVLMGQIQEQANAMCGHADTQKISEYEYGTTQFVKNPDDVTYDLAIRLHYDCGQR